MPKQIDIEYCGSWGYGGAAKRLKEAIEKGYGDKLDIKVHPANDVTSTIKVSWINGGQLKTVW